MTTSPLLGLTLLAANQASAEVVVNEAIVKMESLLSRRCLSRTTATPPAHADGALYIVGPSATGAWTGLEDTLQLSYGGSWRTISRVQGIALWVVDEGSAVYWNGTAWKAVVGETIYFGNRASSNQSSITTWTNVQWNNDVRKDSVYTHSTSSNPDQITLEEAGQYDVSVDVTVEATGTAGYNRIDAKLILGGSDVQYGFASQTVRPTDIPRATISLRAVIVATAGQVLQVAVQRQAGSSTIAVVYDWTRITIRRI